MDQWDQEIWGQVDLHQMVWVTCILIWMMQELIMDQDLKVQTVLLQEQIWMVMEWLRLHHLMIQPMTWFKKNR